ncbi:MAG: carbonic anhydrase [Peptostreptococcus sp.]|uniref:carbonic anhydrase n=1 Tax=Peptostreptococcus sp. TaxID=1262 RepID=UPI002FCBD977
MRDKLLELLNYNEEFRKRVGQSYFDKIQGIQTPWLTLVACCDSRIHTNIMMDDATNEVFEIRVIGNVIENALGSVDYGVYQLRTPMLFIMGHSDCGAIKGSLDDRGKLQESIENTLEPIRKNTKIDAGKKLSNYVIDNIENQVEYALNRYKTLVESGELVIVGGYYDFDNSCSEGCGKIVLVNYNGDPVYKNSYEIL